MVLHSLQDGSDGQDVRISRAAFAIITTLSNMMGDLSPSAEGQQVAPVRTPIPVNKASSATLALVAQYCEYRAHHPALPEVDQTGKERALYGKKMWMSPWEDDFFRGLSKPDLINVANAADFLEIECLCKLACQEIAFRLGELQDPAAFADFLGMPASTTKEQQEALLAEHAWARELAPVPQVRFVKQAKGQTDDIEQVAEQVTEVKIEPKD